VILVIAVVVIIDQRLHDRISEQTVDELAREARLVAAEWRSTDSADALADSAGAALGHRVTLIAPNGVVQGDTDFNDGGLHALQNHNTRPEVVEARRSGTGSARRTSASAGDEELYVAVIAPLGVARVSLPTRAIEEVFDRARRDVLLAGLIALVLAALLGFWFSRTVSQPIVELRDVARAIADGDITRRPALAAPGEVGDLATALYRLAEQLGARLSALQADQALLSAVIQSLEEGVLAVDAASQVVQINDSARSLLGIRATVPFPVDLLPRSGELRDALSHALRGENSETVELTLGDRTLSLTARPLAHGGAVLALLDLTSVRRLESVRRDFVANVSHELRTPLTVVAGFAETLSDANVPEEKRRDFTQKILENATRMQRMVDDLLDLSRIESGGWVPNPGPVDVQDVARDVVGALSDAASRNGTRISVSIAPDARELYADRTALRQVISNLVDNAIRYTKDGEITISTVRAGEEIAVAVADTGAGIAPEHLSRIFERFYRADSGRARGTGGTGLGLAIVRHLVERHGGRVDATSAPGKGTTIRAYFPGQPVRSA
jgi:two-component system, OmpR family, phosphate regulon sensor histidine kinase PhoR